MGHSLSYQALPEDSRLFARLRTDRKTGTLFARLFNCGGGPYTWAELDDLDDILDGVAEDDSVFASREEVDRAMADLLADLEDARSAHPGLEDRRAYLEKTEEYIEKRLTRHLAQRGRKEAAALVQAFLFGAATLTPPGVRGPLGGGLSVIPSAMVRKAASVLGEMTAESLCAEEDEEDWLEDFQSWREMYLAAAAHREAVIVGH
jgi:hypothetical protein